MIRLATLGALAALLTLPAGAAVPAPTRAAAAPAGAAAPADPAKAAGPRASDAVVAVAAWAIRSGDPRGLPSAIVDKSAARVFVFGADGKLKGEAPALIGSAVGDRSEPYQGDRELSDIPPAERTTPAGRYFAAWGPATGGKKVLWVDYATAVSIHPLASVEPGERRKQRLASASPADNRITFGCINVSPTFFKSVVAATFRKAGVFYVLPETMPLQQAFPGFQPPPGLTLAAH